VRLSAAAPTTSVGHVIQQETRQRDLFGDKVKSPELEVSCVSVVAVEYVLVSQGR